MGHAIGFYIIDEDMNTNTGLQTNNMPFLFLGEGYYLFDKMAATELYAVAREQKFHAQVISYVYEDNKQIDFDSQSDSQYMYDRFKEIWEEIKQSSRDIRFESRSQLFGFLCQVYKDTHRTDLLSLTLRDETGLYRIVKNDIPYEVRMYIEKQKLYCLSSTVRMRIMKQSRIN